MRPEIADLVRGHIYDVLYDHESVQSYPKVKGVSSNLFLIQHSEPEKENDLSHSNEYEAAYLAALCKFILQQGYSPSQITVLVTYTGQLLLIRKYMPISTFEGVRVTTVDNFQGEENDIILLSLVRSNDHGVIGFLKAENRVCVALSRAKHGFYCIGNFEMLRKGSETWQKIVSEMESKAKVGESLSIHCNNHPQFQERAKYPGDFAKHFPTGGCHLPCEYRLKCGHVCALTCHSYDPEHEKYTCEKPVSEVCPEGHRIERLCFQESICNEVVVKIVPNCGHLQQMLCHQDPYEVHCQEVCIKAMPSCGHSQEMRCCEDPRIDPCHSRCEKQCPGGHECPLLCYQECKPCKEQSEVQLPQCSHIQQKYCYQEITDIKCMAICKKTCQSGHPCQLKCYQGCTPCSIKVDKAFPCGHTVKVRCSEASVAKCGKPCQRDLSCGHKCPSLCGESCSDVSCLESVEITLPRCKHKERIPCQKKSDRLYRLRMKCTNPCQKKLSCGHNCTGICGDPCIEICEVGGITKTCPQRHELIRKCFETFDSSPCDRKCSRKLRCGHRCQNLCGERCTAECKFPVLKNYPCGHQHRLQCSSPIEDHPCDFICRSPLVCGHTCRGKCSECRSARIHKPCEYFVVHPHFCGERIQMKCVGLQDCHGKMKVAEPQLKVLPCMHTKMPYECGKDVYKCLEQCQWSCPHQECTKLCHETCNRLPCNEKCPHTLACGHKCVGLCGEPCINVCPECDQEDFRSILIVSEEFSAEETYTQLSCGHIFTIQEMDKYVRQRQSCDIGPLHCPQCSSLLSCSYRYGNHAKEALSHVEAVKAKVQTSTAQSNMSAREKDHLSHILRHSFSIISERDIYKRCLVNFKLKLSRPQKVVSKEAGFVVYILSKVFAFASSISDSVSAGAYKKMMTHLVSMAEDRQLQLSYQIIQDLLSELYRLCYQAKLNACQQNVFGSSMKVLIEKGRVFLMSYNDPNCQMSKKDFISHSKLLDIASKHLSTFESTDEFIKDIELFLPPVSSGCWKKCAFQHYYCIPVCKAGTVTMKCPECTGNSESIERAWMSGTTEVDITQQLSLIVGNMKSISAVGAMEATGEVGKLSGKKKKKKKRRH